MVTIEKVEPQELQIIVTGTVNGKEVRTMGSKWPYVNAKSAFHAARYAKQLLVNASGEVAALTPDEAPRVQRFAQVESKQVFQEAPSSGFSEGGLLVHTVPDDFMLTKLGEFERRIAALEALTLWTRIRKYFGLG